jgi:hypothetical protein
VVDLTTIFGPHIKVFKQIAQNEKQYVGFPGCDGVVAMDLGLRGNQVVITGRLYATGADYEAARAALQVWLDDLELYQTAEAAEYAFAGSTFSNMVFDRINLIPDGEGKLFHYSAEGYCFCNFVAFARILV